MWYATRARADTPRALAIFASMRYVSAEIWVTIAGTTPQIGPSKDQVR